MVQDEYPLPAFLAAEPPYRNLVRLYAAYAGCDSACFEEGVINFHKNPEDAALRVRIHNQNMTTAASAQADRKTFGHLS